MKFRKTYIVNQEVNLGCLIAGCTLYEVANNPICSKRLSKIAFKFHLDQDEHDIFSLTCRNTSQRVTDFRPGN